jgi:cobalt-zinc-cadmium resistance protein CzcA
MHAVESANENAAGGFVAQGPMEWSVRAVGRVQTIGDLQQTVVGVRGQVPVLLGDVADIREAPAIRRGVAHRLKGEVVSARVVKQFGADTVKVAEGIRAGVADLERALPPGVTLRIVYDQSALVDRHWRVGRECFWARSSSSSLFGLLARPGARHADDSGVHCARRRRV